MQSTFPGHCGNKPFTGSRGLAILTLVMALLGVVPAAMAAPEGAQALKQACKSDYKSLCSGVQPGGGRILDCLKKNHDKLSPTCQKALSDAKAARQSAAPAQP